MIKLLFSFILYFTFTIAAFAQSDKEEIKKTLDSYFLSVAQKDNAKTLDYIYPKLFEKFTKDKMLEALDKMESDTAIIVTLDKGTITSISETMELDGIKYAYIKYTFKMTMTIKADTTDSEADGEDNLNSADFTYELLKEQFGEKQVQYDREKSSFNVNMTENYMYAINDPVYKGWTFLEKKPNLMPILGELLPKKVLKKF